MTAGARVTRAALRVLIKGAGEQASATAHRLFRCGFAVAMTDLARPTAIRRGVSFCTAIDEGSITIEGVRGARVEPGALAGTPPPWDHVAVGVDPDAALVAAWRPDVLVDARILKRPAGTRREDAPLVIGLGPGLEAGRDVHVAVETNRGHDLGRIVTAGRTHDDTGQPGDIGGFTHERLLRAPRAGLFTSARTIGDRVAAGDVIGAVDGQALEARIAGVLRGLLPHGLVVEAGQKLADVDPRGDPALCRTLSDKARTISGSVLEIVVAHVLARDP